MAQIDSKTILNGNDIFIEFKGSLTEQYVLNEIKANTNIPIFYWSAEKGNAELDYIIQLNGENMPIEVKANENLKSKSLKIFVEKYNTKTNIRTSLSDYRKEDWLTNIPLYLIGNIERIVT